jgi:hypothetical protein
VIEAVEELARGLAGADAIGRDGSHGRGDRRHQTTSLVNLVENFSRKGTRQRQRSFDRAAVLRDRARLAGRLRRVTGRSPPETRPVTALREALVQEWPRASFLLGASTTTGFTRDMGLPHSKLRITLTPRNPAVAAQFRLCLLWVAADTQPTVGSSFMAVRGPHSCEFTPSSPSRGAVDTWPAAR